ncbi:MAG: NAD+ kinase [Leptospiraceae bacterium]|nr:NAD+ kinase [Leptospiraceae bacterium]MCP5502511.1 NAD+ kinase [Leptospiraceae bacterium]
MTKLNFSPERILIVSKRTRYELDTFRYADEKERKKIYKLIKLEERIMASHERQVKSREEVRNIFPEITRLVYRQELEKLNLKEFDLIIALGGDNHFTYIGHYCIQNDIYIIGCNSDTETSMGAMLSFSAETLKETVQNDWSDVYVEEWPLIIARITHPDGRKVETFGTISEITVRNNNPDLISSYHICFDGIREKQKSSGLLFCTGAGSTGWYLSCHQNDEETDPSFPKTAPYFKAYSRELSKTARKNYKLNDFKVETCCKIISDMDGGICVDSLPERRYDFPSGSIAEFSLSFKKLKVIRKKDPDI